MINCENNVSGQIKSTYVTIGIFGKLGMIKSKIFNALPHPLKQGLRYAYGAIPLSVRYGKVFRDTYAFLQESQWWSWERLEEYQMQQLSRLLHHAYQNVPYYRTVFDERGLKPGDIQNFDDMKRLPYLTREIARANLSDLKANNLPESTFEYASTSGSTGIPLWFYRERGVTSLREAAFHARMRGWIGYGFTDKCAVLRGNVVKKRERDSTAWWEYDPIDKLLFLSLFHMTKDNLSKYLDKLNEFHPKFIQAYPSGITILARYMKEQCIELTYPMEAILCGSENLHLWQRELLEDVFRCRIYSWYGHTEEVTLAGGCERDNRYHLFNEYGITELVKSDGSLVDKEGEVGEIVGTGFNNCAMPFIRYKTGDLAVYTQERCSCGRNYSLIKSVEGRTQEFLVARDGHLTSLGDMQIVAAFDNVRQFQFYQEEKGKAVFNVVKMDAYTEQDTECIKKALNERFGDSVELTIRFVDHIPRTERGKYQYLIQKLPIEYGVLRV